MEFTKQAEHVLKEAKARAYEAGHPYIGTEHLLMGLCSVYVGVAGQVLAASQVTEEKVRKVVEELVSPIGEGTSEEKPQISPRLECILEESHQEARKLKADRTGTEHMLLAVIGDPDCVAARILTTLNVNLQKIWQDILAAVGENPQNYQDEGSHRMEVLEQYGTDLTAQAAEGKLDPVIGRETEIGRLMQILSRRTKNNPCLIGEPGVGKTAVIEGLAMQIASGLVPEGMKNKKILTLDLSGMIAGSKYRGEFEERMKKLIQEVKGSGNVILFLDEVHTIIGAGGAEGAIDASNILKPCLARGEIQLIGATTITEYRKYIEKDAALERRFQPVTVEEPDEAMCLEILKGLRPRYETHHHVRITDEGLEAAVKLSQRYINDRHLPDKAIDVIDEACSKISLAGFKVPQSIRELEEEISGLAVEKEICIKTGDLARASVLHKQQEESAEKLSQARKRMEKNNKRKQLVVSEDAISQVVSEWTKIPLSKLKESESAKLRKLEQILHKRVVGQEEAVGAVARAVRRGRVGLKDPKRPVGSFLFLGPTGVGKTELSKALAEALFGSEDSMIRIDMSEYMEKHSVAKMIGSPPGYVGHEDGGQLSEKVRRNPYAVVLFDEIEKAHPDVFNILLQVLDDGHITDSQGRKVDFRNTVIIMTSNAGAKAIVDPKHLGFIMQEDETADYKKMKSNVMDEVKQIFRPEFLNRIDEIIVFHALNKENMKQIAGMMCREFALRAKDQLQIELHIRDSVKQHIVEKGTDKKFGARPLRRTVQSLLEDKLAEEILEKKVLPGMQVDVTISKGDIKFLPKDTKN